MKKAGVLPVNPEAGRSHLTATARQSTDEKFRGENGLISDERQPTESAGRVKGNR